MQEVAWNVSASLVAGAAWSCREGVPGCAGVTWGPDMERMLETGAQAYYVLLSCSSWFI